MESINESISFYNVIEKHKADIGEGTSKLCVSPCLLSLVNEALDNLKSNGKSTPVDIPYEERLILFDLENIFKSSSKFKLFQRNIATFAGVCNLKRCTSLKHLEFLRISLDNVTGFDTENEIDYISCSRCANVFELFVNNVWCNLKILSLSYCQLNKIEAECFSNLKTVQQLNLSFNCLKSVKGLESLSNLECLDASYNFFEEIPNFSKESNSCLKKLYISHNNITSLSGLSKLENLTHFDASDNCIYIKEILVELYSLKHLKWLKLIDNPLCLRKYYRMYVSHFLGTVEPPFQFILDEVPLSDAELDFIGTSKGAPLKKQIPPLTQPTSSLPQVVVESEVIQEKKSILKSSNRKAKKGREVVIIDPSIDHSKLPGASSKPRKIEVQQKEIVNSEYESTGNCPANNSHELKLSGSESLETVKKKDSLPSNSLEINVNKNDEVYQVLMVDQNNTLNEAVLKPTYSELHSSPESVQPKLCTVVATIHATEDYPVTENNQLSIPNLTLNDPGNHENELQSPEDELKELKTIDMDDTRLLESIDLILQKERTENENNMLTNSNDLTDVPSEFSSKMFTEKEHNFGESENIIQDSNEKATNEDYDKSTELKQDSSFQQDSDDSAYEDELNTDENLWAVQKIVDSKPVNIFLVLLDLELRERSTISGRTIATYPLAFIESCTQVKDDPITIELVFSSLLKRTTVRTYVMEFADAQTLINKMTVFLSSRPEEVEDHLTSFLCKSCNAFFAVYKTKARTLCTVCGSALVTEMDKPELEVVQEPLSNSSSQSSIVSSSHAAPETKTSINIDTNPSAVSSGEESEKSGIVNSLYTSAPFQKYESDIEIISNPSQSSIEVLDESRDTPSRKRSSEERHVMITPALPTLQEVSDALTSISEITKLPVPNGEDTNDASSDQNIEIPTQVPDLNLIEESMPLSDDKPNTQQLTESSSSGSIMTSYEASGAVINSQLATVINDIPEVSIEASDISNDAYESCVEENNVSLIESVNLEGNNPDIYSYTNFTEVDHRIKAFLYQYVFHDDSEELTLLVRCHLWKTGGTDYPACFVLSNHKIYIFMHSSSDYGLDASDWLKLLETFDLKSMKRVFPLVWNIGIGVVINHLSYFILLQNKTYSDNLLAAFKGLSLKSCDVGSKVSSKVELSLQQVVLTSKYVHNVIDPTILFYTVCPSINILKDDELEETMKLGGFVMTANEFYIVLGDFSWLAGSGEVPSIHFFHMMSSLIEVEQRESMVSLHFLDETEAVEVVWRLHCANRNQVIAIIDSMRAPWENVFAQPLQVSVK